MGIVGLTGSELADQKRSILSRGEMTPFSERGSAVLLEEIAAVEVAILVEVVVDRGMDAMLRIYAPDAEKMKTWKTPQLEMLPAAN